EKTGKLLGEMVPAIRKTSALVQGLAAASQKQPAGVGQINGAIGQTTQISASFSEKLVVTAEDSAGWLAPMKPPQLRHHSNEKMTLACDKPLG
ncbi:MAG: methyl-accepting chemotaxis protein, partial [Proteobacteria bacterium]|nr:methyl-accepting chemotaxis protein [Pseudomonadota bacterium]